MRKSFWYWLYEEGYFIPIGCGILTAISLMLIGIAIVNVLNAL